MRRRKKTWTADLTPLLDVIFILLFLVMFTSVRTQTDRVEAAEAAQQQAEKTARKAQEEAREAQARAADLEKLLEDSSVLTVRIFSEADYRVVFVEDGQETASLQFDWDSTQDLPAFLRRELSARIGGVEGDGPVFLVFTYDAADLYESDFRAAQTVFSEMLSRYSNVFIQIREDDEHEQTGR